MRFQRTNSFWLEMFVIAGCILTWVIVSLWQRSMFATAPANHIPIRITIRDVFGEAVPDATVTVGATKALGGEYGIVEEMFVPSGIHELSIEAPGYKVYKRSIQVTRSLDVSLKYDSGLWPDGFAANFKVYFSRGYDNTFRAFADIAFANGSSIVKYMITKCWIEDPTGTVVKDLLVGELDYRGLIGSSTDDNHVTSPELAAVMRPNSLARVQPVALGEQFYEDQEYVLIIVYTKEAELAARKYETLQVVDIMNCEEK